jgi:hypothetical protein
VLPYHTSLTIPKKSEAKHEMRCAGPGGCFVGDFCRVVDPTVARTARIAGHPGCTALRVKTCTMSPSSISMTLK